MNREAFGANLRSARELRGWTQHELGRRVGLTNTMVSFYETGRNLPTLDRFATLCATLGVGASRLLDGAYPTVEAPERSKPPDGEPVSRRETGPRIDF